MPDYPEATPELMALFAKSEAAKAKCARLLKEFEANPCFAIQQSMGILASEINVLRFEMYTAGQRLRATCGQ
jgi:hypothetical protein